MKEASLFTASSGEGIREGEVTEKGGSGKSASAHGGSSRAASAAAGGGGSTSTTTSDPDAEPLVIAVGCRVEIAGIKSKPALNGLTGVVKKPAATKTTKRWHVQLDDTDTVISLSEGCLTPIAAAPVQCYICLDDDSSVIPLGCACRTHGAHIECLSEAAGYAGKSSWTTCSLCHQDYTGRVLMGLATEHELRSKHAGSVDEERANTIRSKELLADAHMDKGEFQTAEVMYRELLALPTISHNFKITTTHQLALVLHYQGKNGDSIKMHRKNLAMNSAVQKILEQTGGKLGRRDPKSLSLTSLKVDQLGSQSDLASALLHTGEIEEATTLYHTTLATMKQVLGEDHRYTLATKASYATTLLQFESLFDQSRAAEGKTMLLEVIADQSRILGPEHPTTLTHKGAFAQVLVQQGQCEEAVPMLRECYKLEAKIYTERHPSVLETANSLGTALQMLGQYAEAETILKKTLKLSREVLGAEHYRTKITEINLRSLLRVDG